MNAIDSCISRPLVVLLLLLFPYGVSTSSAQAGPVLEFHSAILDGQGGLDGLTGAGAAAVSPDGRFVYVLAFGDQGVAVFEKQGNPGRLVQRHLYRAGLGGYEVLEDPLSLTMSADGRNVYVGTFGRLVVFQRDQDTGALSLLEVHRHGEDGVGGIFQPWHLLVSGDGQTLYVADFGDALGVFSRSPADGSLTFVEEMAGRVEVEPGDIRAPFDFAWGLAESPDGRHLYLGALVGGLSTFLRDPGTGRLSLVENLRIFEPIFVTAAVPLVSSDGQFVYLSQADLQRGLGGDAILVFGRDAETGRLSLAGGCCEGLDVPQEPEGVADFGFPSLAFAAEGSELLATYFVEGRVARFAIDSETGDVSLVELLGDEPVFS